MTKKRVRLLKLDAALDQTPSRFFFIHIHIILIPCYEKSPASLYKKTQFIYFTKISKMRKNFLFAKSKRPIETVVRFPQKTSETLLCQAFASR